MNYTIENDLIKVEIATRGAELMSIKLKEDNCEYLWQGDPEFWGGRAYNMFPICGRLTDGKYNYNGKTYEMILHGFARKAEFTMTAQEKDRITFNLSANEDTLKIYPFNFSLDITYILDNTTIKMQFDVKNNDDKLMYFALGGHPGFNVPLCKGECFEDYYVEFACEKPAKRLLYKECYMSDDTAPIPLINGKIMNLTHSMFDDEAIFMTDICRTISLKSKRCNKSVTLSFPDMQYVGLWHKEFTEAPLVCIEPWQSVPAYFQKIDDLETKRDMNKLAPNDKYSTTYTITIE